MTAIAQMAKEQQNRHLLDQIRSKPYLANESGTGEGIQESSALSNLALHATNAETT